MLQVLYDGKCGETELSGTRPALLALGRQLRGAAGTCDLAESGNPSPYERSLSQIAFREDPEREGASIVTEGPVLWIRGGREALDLLAENIEDFAAEADATAHCHVEYQTYDYIASDSDPLVITFTR
ncbi:hypothetical protein ACIRS1_06710 [Kitasatospora sp. NPDC101176]|uniref:Imm32 family immunity protein n=1 Tax=Kitasatospora sp. NPDC101176 TaxID=3364099 RepID=UPI003808FC5E